jgi:FAD synthase
MVSLSIPRRRRGRGIGGTLTVPTINLAPYQELLPPNGVYVTQLRVAGEWFDAVTNVGNRPTFGADSFAVESHLLDFRPHCARRPDAPEASVSSPAS